MDIINQTEPKAELPVDQDLQMDVSGSSTLDSANSSIDKRAGASTDGGITGSSLPMVLILKESDELFNSFNLDAQTVMEELGIKRSRLTQISGRELRVARKKIGQYIRPMYRQEDVNEYKSWSRATATHQKASSMVQQAADSLEQKALDLTKTLTTSIDEFTTLLQDSFHHIRSDILQDKLEQKQLLSNLEDRISTTVNHSTNIHQEFLQNSSSSILDRISVIEQKLLTLKDIKTSLDEVLAEVKTFITDTTHELISKTDETSSKLELVSSICKENSLILRSVLGFQKEALLKTDLVLKTKVQKNIRKKAQPNLKSKIRRLRSKAR